MHIRHRRCRSIPKHLYDYFWGTTTDIFCERSRLTEGSIQSCSEAEIPIQNHSEAMEVVVATSFPGQQLPQG